MRLLLCFALLVTASTAAGCRMCCAPDDPNYSAYGGRWERDDRQFGRVGSLFNPAGSRAQGEYIVEGEGYIEGESYIDEGPTPTPAVRDEQPQPPMDEDGEMAYYNSEDGPSQR